MQQGKILILGLLSLTTVCVAGDTSEHTSPCRPFRERLTGVILSKPALFIEGGAFFGVGGWFVRHYRTELGYLFNPPTGAKDAPPVDTPLTEDEMKSDKKLRSDAYVAFVKALEKASKEKVATKKLLAFSLAVKGVKDYLTPEVTIWKDTKAQEDLASKAKNGLSLMALLKGKKLTFPEGVGLPIKLAKILFVPIVPLDGSQMTDVTVQIETSLGYTAVAKHPISIHSLFEEMKKEDPLKIEFNIREGTDDFTFVVNTRGETGVNWLDKKFVMQNASVHVEVLGDPNSVQDLPLPSMTTAEKLP